MESEEQNSECSANLYPQEFELLKGMFEDHFSSEVIAGVLEDCYGDGKNNRIIELLQFNLTVLLCLEVPTSFVGRLPSAPAHGGTHCALENKTNKVYAWTAY